MATKRKVIITGDKQLTKWLNELEAKTARRLHRTASRTAAKLILGVAKGMVPRESGKFGRSLSVRSIARSRSRLGHVVTQRLNYQKQSRTIPGRQAYYGVFQEIGWTVGGKRKQRTGNTQTIGSVRAQARRQMLGKSKAGSPRKIQGKWAVRRAGVSQESNAIRLYHSELNKLLSSQGGTP